MKFGLMLTKAESIGIDFDYFSTGHYARIVYDETKGKYLLKKAKYLPKDQSYFLSYLPQETLAKTKLPLGDYTKPEVREIAAKIGLFNSDKIESQDFYLGDYNDIINMNGKISREGNIVDISGRVLGKHGGITNFTIGQRKGLGISSDRPLYVVALDSETNEVIVDYIEGLAKSYLYAKDINWSQGECYGEKFRAEVKIRYRHNPAPATVTVLDENKIKIDFDEPQNAITPGQLACMYDGDTVIGSGWIE
jgi:tRNA-specific 2-thiouridylase